MGKFPINYLAIKQTGNDSKWLKALPKIEKAKLTKPPEPQHSPKSVHSFLSATSSPDLAPTDSAPTDLERKNSVQRFKSAFDRKSFQSAKRTKRPQTEVKRRTRLKREKRSLEHVPFSLKKRFSLLDALKDRSLFFNDGVRRIDYVLVWRESLNNEEEYARAMKRALFEEALKKNGIELEYSLREYEQGEETTFVKLHATWPMLMQYAELTNVKVPLAPNDLLDDSDSCFKRLTPKFFTTYPVSIPKVPDYFTTPFSRSREENYNIKDKDSFFSPAQRSLLLSHSLSRVKSTKSSCDIMSLKKMLAWKAYDSGYPLHSGDYNMPGIDQINERHLLYSNWANPKVWYKFQPLDIVRSYFGEKIGIYFSWLGLYTSFLTPAAILGLLVFLYGVCTIGGDQTSTEVCDDNLAGNFIMCPQCDKRCSYYKLSRSCVYSTVTHFFDNEATVAFAAFMALWATTFLSVWKRKANEIAYDWDVANYEEEETVRPEFEETVRKRRINPINQAEEPYLEFRAKCFRVASSLSAVIFMLMVVVAAVFAVIVYRVAVSASLYAVSDKTIKQRSNVITAASAAALNLVIIIVLGRLYKLVAEKLTNFETPKTMTDWEDSFTLKMFCFQFVNHYASIFYIAFFKGR